MVSLEPLKQSVSGIVIAREGAADSHVIVGATSVADVQAAVRFAHRFGLKVTARESAQRRFDAVVEEGIVIDLSALNHVKIDPAARIAQTGPVVTKNALAHALGPHGLVCVRVECVDVVTAEGELIRASTSENPEIYRAARGSGTGFFGIIVAYRLRLQRLPCAIAPSGISRLSGTFSPDARASAGEGWESQAPYAVAGLTRRESHPVS